MLTILALILLLGFGFYLFLGTKIIPQQEAWVVQRLGKFHRILHPGPNWILPFSDKIAYKHSLKEEAIDIHAQTAITQDNVSVVLDGILYVKIIDPVAASYGVKNPHYAISQLVKTSMRSEIGKIPLDKTFEERETLNAKIVHTINEAATSWGIKCLRYEIKDITMPEDIRKAMELQMTAERQKRARILESEGLRQSQINESEGKKQAAINLAEAEKHKILLESEAHQQAKINKAKGEAAALEILATATSHEIEIVAEAIKDFDGEKVLSLRLAEHYVEAFKQIAQKSTTFLLPADSSSPGNFLTQAFALFDQVKQSQKRPLKEILNPEQKSIHK